jgi:adenylate cyclase
VGLTDTARNALLWSDKYDADLKDVFSVQDQITRRLAGALAVQVTGLEIAQSVAKPPGNLEAYDLVLRGRDALSRVTRAGNAEARTLFERAIALDPGYGPAYVGLGRVNHRAMANGWTADPRSALERAESLARKAIELDDLSPGAHALLGDVALYLGDYDRAVNELRRAVDLNGSDAEAHSGLVTVLLWTGDLQGAVAAGELLAQFRPDLSSVESFHLATAYLLADNSAEAVRILERVRDRNRMIPPTEVMLAAAYAAAGRQEDAERQAAVAHRRYPGFSREEFGSLLRDPGQRQKLAHALGKAGL